MFSSEQKKWETMTIDEKNTELYYKQINTLKLFLERNAITREEYEKSKQKLDRKMNIQVRTIEGRI